MPEGVVIRNTPLLKSSFIDDGNPIRQKVHFLDDKWDYRLNGQSRTSPHLTNKVRNEERKKEMNKCMAEIYEPGGIRTRAARLISQYHNH